MDIQAKRIAYISDQQFPVEKADAEQVVNTISALCSHGMSVDLVIPAQWSRSKPRDSKRARAIADFFHVERNFRVRSLRHLPMSRLRPEKYAHGIVAPLYARSRGYDMVYTRNPMSAVFAARLGLRVVFETYRIYRSTLITRKMAGSMCRSNWLAVICHSQPSRESLLQLGLPAHKTAVIHNGYNPALFDPPLSRSQARESLGLTMQRKIATYSGRLDREKGVAMLLRLAAETPEISYYLIGKTQKDPPAWLHDMADKMGLRNVHQVAWRPLKELVAYLFASDLLIIPPTSAPMLRYGKTVLPLKLFIYLAAGRPIMAPQLADMLGILSEHNALLVPPDDVTTAVTSMRRLFARPQWQEAMAVKASHDARKYTWRNRAGRIIDFLNDRLGDA